VLFFKVLLPPSSRLFALLDGRTNCSSRYPLLSLQGRSLQGRSINGKKGKLLVVNSALRWIRTNETVDFLIGVPTDRLQP